MILTLIPTMQVILCFIVAMFDHFVILIGIKFYCQIEIISTDFWTKSQKRFHIHRSDSLFFSRKQHPSGELQDILVELVHKKHEGEREVLQQLLDNLDPEQLQAVSSMSRKERQGEIGE